MKLPLHIAGRYLFAKKSHNVINIISTTSMVGMAVGTAAIIVILSVYNGFSDLVRGMDSRIAPDFLVAPSEGKFFTPEGDAWDEVCRLEGVKTVCTVLEDNVFVSYDGRDGAARVKGVDEIYAQESPLERCTVDGEFTLGSPECRMAAVGTALARSLGINRRFTAPLELYYPSRERTFSPLSSVQKTKVWPGCEVSVGSEADRTLCVVDIEVMRSLLGLQDEVSAVEIRLEEGIGRARQKSLEKEIGALLGEDFRVLERDRQNPVLYRMLRYEKASIYLIMIFVVLIIGFSIFGCQSMTIIEKTQDIFTLRSMGADKGTLRRIFTLQGWMVSLFALAAGLPVGVIFSLLQHHLGLVKMPGLYIVEAYPAALQWGDVALTAFGVALLGWLIARASSLRVKKI